MKITYYGHACFSVQVGSRHLLFDPFITPNELARQINVNAIPANYILVSHGHADHLLDAAAIAKRTGATVISNFEITVWFGKQGVPKTHPLNHGGACRFDFGRVKYVNAIHSSSLPDGSYGGNPGGFVVETAEGNFYYSGDTALTLDMKLIGESTRLNFAALPIGDNFTMGVADAIKAAEWVGCDQVLGLHYDTFPPIKIDRAAAVQQFSQAGKTLHLPAIGASINL
ncbi:MAG TPA: metal-dependent hydrolase [Verrucomicrobiota bacterium]|nr:metal-dependent hydrolase [Verrucomicrobiota bacterium]HRT09083.1 metal-dependent hydrolase [Candidatus Paceibacterota bacterium]HRT56411.1 metal-dependent hydrolase [Candidatus Paceibacterota bacterium]